MPYLSIYGIIPNNNNIKYRIKNHDNYHNLLLNNHMISCVSGMIGNVFIDNDIHNFRHNVPLYNYDTFTMLFVFLSFIINIFPLNDIPSQE